MLTPGNTVGRYVVRRKLAEGGMAEIYVAAAQGPEGFSKDVVLKVVRGHLAGDRQFVDMFITEARLASKLNHANVVQIFDFGKHDETYYLAMEYVRGTSLHELKARVRTAGLPFPPVLAAEIGAQIARGLHSAHTATDRGTPLGIVHRDVSPHNVLLSFDGAVKLTDFGIAKASTSQTAPGMLKGKFAYMSPEQSKGESVDPRTDVFALGVVLWELLAGGRLFEAATDVATLRSVQQSVITPPARLNPDVPQELSDVVMKALSRPLDERYATAAELERALATCVLKAAKRVEDTSVTEFLRPLYGDEIRASLPAALPAMPAAGPGPTDALAEGSTMTVPRPQPAAHPREFQAAERRTVPERPASRPLPGAPAQAAAGTVPARPASRPLPEGPAKGPVGTEKMPSVKRLPDLPRRPDASERETEQMPSMRQLPQLPQLPTGSGSLAAPAAESDALPLPRLGTASVVYPKDSGSNPTFSATELAPDAGPPRAGARPGRGAVVAAVALGGLSLGSALGGAWWLGRVSSADVDPARQALPVAGATPPAQASSAAPQATGRDPRVRADLEPAVARGAPVEGPAAVAAAHQPEATSPSPAEDAAPKTAPPPPGSVTASPADTGGGVVAPPRPVEPPRVATPAVGWIDVRPRPFASVSLNGKFLQDAEGPLKIPVKPGAYDVELKHPRLTRTVRVLVKAGEAVQVPFDARTAP